ncbi:MAG: chorismate mutase [Lachnospiraceae bacterium]|jgi:chorismate mutase
MDLEQTRKKIDEADIRMKELFLKRLRAADEVVEAKSVTHDSVWQPGREEQIYRERMSGVPDGCRREYRLFLENVVRISREYQYSERLRRDLRFPYSLAEEPAVTSVAALPGIRAGMAESNGAADAEQKGITADKSPASREEKSGQLESAARFAAEHGLYLTGICGDRAFLGNQLRSNGKKQLIPALWDGTGIPKLVSALCVDFGIPAVYAGPAAGGRFFLCFLGDPGERHVQVFLTMLYYELGGLTIAGTVETEK